MENEKITHLINDEKENKQKTKKNNIIRIILIVVSCFVLVMSILFNSYYMYRLGYEKGIEIYKPLYLQNEINKPIKKADLNASLEWENEFYYPNYDFYINTDINNLNSFQNQALIYFVDNTTYLYYVIDNQEITFTITNGTVGYRIASYTLVVGNDGFEPEMIEVSDGYLHYFVVNEMTTTYFYNTYFTGLFVNYMPDYESFGINTEPYLLSIGGTNSVINYDKGYNAGANDKENDVVNNPNKYGLYSYQQYIDNYNQGVNYGVNSVSPDIVSNGFITLMNVIFNAPYNIFNGFLNFEIFGVNLFNLLSFIFTTSIALFVVRLIFLKK